MSAFRKALLLGVIAVAGLAVFTVVFTRPRLDLDGVAIRETLLVSADVDGVAPAGISGEPSIPKDRLPSGPGQELVEPSRPLSHVAPDYPEVSDGRSEPQTQLGFA